MKKLSKTTIYLLKKLGFEYENDRFLHIHCGEWYLEVGINQEEELGGYEVYGDGGSTEEFQNESELLEYSVRFVYRHTDDEEIEEMEQEEEDSEEEPTIDQLKLQLEMVTYEISRYGEDMNKFELTTLKDKKMELVSLINKKVLTNSE